VQEFLPVKTATVLLLLALLLGQAYAQDGSTPDPTVLPITEQEAKAAEEEKKEKPKPTPLKDVAARTPQEALVLAMMDLRQQADEVKVQRRYLWCPNRSDEEIASAALALNMVCSQTPVDVYAQMLYNGNLIAVDLGILAPEPEEFAKIVRVWASLSDNEPYFHVPQRVTKSVSVKVPRYQATDGKWYETKNENKEVASYLPAPYLGTLGQEIELAMGNPSPSTQSFAPILRVDQWIRQVMTTIDGGKYYEFRGLKVGETTLDEYLISRGVNQKQIEKIGSDERAAMMSHVTAKPRSVTIFQGQGTRPSVGAALVSITDDPFDGEDRAEFDPFRQLLDAKTNGHEVFVTMPSGWVEFTLWDGNKKLVAEAPPNLVADHTIPEPFTRRLQPAISCVRCHAPKSLWQPFTNEVAVMLGDKLRVLGDLKGGNRQAQTLKRLAGLYSGDLGSVIREAQTNASKRTFEVTKLEAAIAFKTLSDVFGQYEYEDVDAKVACKELGINLQEDDALGVKTLQFAVPPRDPSGLSIDDPIVGRFYVEYFDLELGRRTGLTNTRRQFEKVYADMMIRKETTNAARNSHKRR
jgi:hypothetical protein